MQKDLAQQALSALVGVTDITQQDRLLVLHSTLGANELLAERAEVLEGIGPLPCHLEGEGTEADVDYIGMRQRLTVLSQRCDITPNDLLGQPVLLQWLTADSRSELRPFHGLVVDFALLGSDGGLARYELIAEPWIAFLRWRQDSFLFQDMTVVQIVEAVFHRYDGQGKLAPKWRWDLADPKTYPRRSVCAQHAESDWHFVARLLSEEGLFLWVEHEGDPASPGLGSHTVVIADHNGGFAPAQQPQIRLARSHSASFDEDAMQRWSQRGELASDAIDLASHDYRGCDARPVSAIAPNAADLPIHDVPGAYAYETQAQGERLAQRWLEALQQASEQWAGRATVRSLQPLRKFEVPNAPADERGPFVATALVHRARSNFSADMQAHLCQSLGDLPAWAEVPDDTRGRRANASAEPLYAVEITAQRLALPVRAPASAAGLHARPTVHGAQTAIVVGSGPIHTDRDHRVKLQHHWQRGGTASHGLTLPQGDNAPASEASSTWVPVAEMQAGANWGSNFTPRVGQEVVVGYVRGDAERPVVLGGVHNGIGTGAANGGADGQGNQVMGGQGGATGNAPQWFPGQQARGDQVGHNHPAALEGYKSQALASSADGGGGANQLVNDNTPGSNRIEVSTTTATTRLQLGRLRHQQDNLLLQPRGHGIDLSTQAYGAVRAGGGLLLSAHGRPASTDAAEQMDTREPRAVLQSLRTLGVTLAETAQAHEAKLKDEPEPAKLPVFEAHQSLYDSLDGKTGGSGNEGGLGTYASFLRPDLLMAAPAGVAWLTGGSHVGVSGGTTGWTAAEHITITVQRHHATVAAQGIVWATQGQAAQEGPTETGIKLHAATGSFNLQANSATMKLAADKGLTVTSTADAVKVGAPEHVLLNGGGSSLRIDSSGITLTSAGPAGFKAAMKELTGAASADTSLTLPKAELKGCAQSLGAAQAAQAATVALS